MHTNGDTYSLRGAAGRSTARHTATATSSGHVDALVAALSERVAHLEGSVRRLDAALADLENELRELRRQAGSQTVKSAPRAMEFETEPTTQTRWIPGATPRSGSLLRAARGSDLYADGDLND